MVVRSLGSRSLGRAALAVVAIAAFAAPRAVAQPPAAPPPVRTQPFEVSWYVKSPMGTPWADRLDLRGVPVNTDIMMVGAIGLYPAGGPHIAAADPSFMERHIGVLKQGIAAQIPEDYTGYVAIHWANWFPLWSNTVNIPSRLPADAQDYDFKDDWRDYMRVRRPQELAGLSPEEQEEVLARTYEEAAKTVLLASLDACKEVRPHAKWGFFQFPHIGYWDVWKDQMDWLSQAHSERLAWLWDASDALFPCLYQGYETDPTLPPRDATNRYILTEQTRRNTPEENEGYLAAVITESLRLARGKPVIGFVWSRYVPSETDRSSRLVNDTNLAQMIEVPKRWGATGIVVWDYLGSEQDAAAFSSFYDTRLGPRLLAAATDTSLVEAVAWIGAVAQGDPPAARPTMVAGLAPPPTEIARSTAVADPPPPAWALADGNGEPPAAAESPPASPAAPGTQVTEAQPEPRRSVVIRSSGSSRSAAAGRRPPSGVAPRASSAATVKNGKRFWRKPPVILPMWSPPSGPDMLAEAEGATVIVVPGSPTMPPWATAGDAKVYEP